MSEKSDTKHSYPRLDVVTESATAIYDHLYTRLYYGNSRERITFLRGSRMKRFESMMAEISAAFQFPPYFMDTYPGLADCLSDLDWLPAISYKTIILDADVLLTDEPVERPAFYRALGIAQENFWEALQNLELVGRGRTEFHIILQVESATEFMSSLNAAGFSAKTVSLSAL